MALIGQVIGVMRDIKGRLFGTLKRDSAVGMRTCVHVYLCVYVCVYPLGVTTS